MSAPQKFRKKPVEIEAMHMAEPNTPDEVARWCGGRVVGDGITGHPYSIEIDTLEGTMRGERGDWIIKGVAGEFYPCREDIFQETYEPSETRTVVLCGNSELDAEEVGRQVASAARRARRGGDAA